MAELLFLALLYGGSVILPEREDPLENDLFSEQVLQSLGSLLLNFTLF